MKEEEYTKYLEKHPCYAEYINAYIETLNMNKAWEAYYAKYKQENPDKEPGKTYKYTVHVRSWPYICYKLNKADFLPSKEWIVAKWMKIVEEPENRIEEMAALKELAKLVNAVDDTLNVKLQTPEKIQICFTDNEDKS